MRTHKFIFIVMSLVLVGVVASSALAGNKRIMSIRAATVLAERALVESIYGLKLRSQEQVEDMVAALFVESSESKTSAEIKNVVIEDVVYDPEKDVAQVTASVSLPRITNIDGVDVDLQNKTFRRVAFATSTPSSAGPLKALRAAEIDAYKQLIRRLVGFKLESQTSVENFMLKSDVVKTKVLSTLFLAEVVEYGWEEDGNAFVKMQLDLATAGALLGEPLENAEPVVEVIGYGAQEDDMPAKEEAVPATEDAATKQ
ncbi:MAG: hypothetical protein JXR59_00415 [Desulfuromonadaceae bacterium]|nr:hypothetical protein [Desulfuromonadaceae bacterium]